MTVTPIPETPERTVLLDRLCEVADVAFYEPASHVIETLADHLSTEVLEHLLNGPLAT